MSEPGKTALAFQAFGPSHLVALAVFAAALATFTLLTRSGKMGLVRRLEIVLAFILILQWPADLWISWRFEKLDMSGALPLHLCDISAFLAAAALLSCRAGLVELPYFWGLAGTLQGLITPALLSDWPHPRFVHFFVFHESIVLAAIHLVYNRKITPRPWSALRAVGWLLVYAVVAGTANALIRQFGGDANYGFLCEKPPTASLFDYLGPWPWYMVMAVPLSLVLFLFLDLPLIIRRRRNRTDGINSSKNF